MTRAVTPYAWLIPALALLLLTSCGGGSGQGATPSPGNPQPTPAGTYVRSFGSRGEDIAHSLAALPNGGLAISGALDYHERAWATSNWLATLDSSGVPVSEQRVRERDAALEYSFSDSVSIEGSGALFLGVVTGEQTGRDVVVRHRALNGTILWEQVLDAGRFAGSVDTEPALVDDVYPTAYPVYDAAGSLSGIWVVAPSTAFVLGLDDDGVRRAFYRTSVTAWFLRPDGAQVSRTRVIHVANTTRGDVLFGSAAVLPNGSLAMLIRETAPDVSDGPWRLLVRRIGQDGTIGAPFVELPRNVDAQIEVVGDALLASWRGVVARLDISAQRMLWQARIASSEGNPIDAWGLTRLRRGGADQIGVAAAVHHQESVLMRLDPASGAVLSSCTIARGTAFDIRDRGEGRLRVFMSNFRNTVIDVTDDCAQIPGGIADMEPGFALSSWDMYGARAEHLSRDGERFHEETDLRIRIRAVDGSSSVELHNSSEDEERGDYKQVVANEHGEIGVAGDTLLQRRRADGRLVGTTVTGVAHASLALDSQGTTWTTQTAAGGANQRCNGGVLLITAAGRAECRMVAGIDLNDMTLSAAPDGSVWASGKSRVILRFAADGAVTSHDAQCHLGAVRVGAGQARVSMLAGQTLDICRETGNGAAWLRRLPLRSFGEQLEIDIERAKVVPAQDGGVAILFTVRQRGEVPGIRSGASIQGDSDLALLKLDQAGGLQWLRVFGGARNEFARDLVVMSDGGYALLGSSNSFDALTPGSVDLFVVRTGPDGHVARTADGGDACQACLGSVSGNAIAALDGDFHHFAAGAAPALLPATTASLTLGSMEVVSTPIAGETNARQCTGEVTNVQENAAPPPPPPPTGGDAPVARFTVSATYAGLNANPVSHHDPARFDASTSAPANNLQRYQWDFDNDGDFDAEGYLQFYTYGTRGEKTARLRVTHANGSTAETTRTFMVDASAGYYIRVRPVHADDIPGNGIERVGGGITCINLAGGQVDGVCFANGSNAPGAETVLRATPVEGSSWVRWEGCDFTRPQTDGPPLCVISQELDGGERLVEAHFAANALAAVTVVMTGTTTPRGRVFSQDNALNCPTTCSAQYPAGSLVQLQATWEVDGEFLRFDNCDSQVDGICFFRLEAAGRTVTAVYR